MFYKVHKLKSCVKLHKIHLLLTLICFFMFCVFNDAQRRVNFKRFEVRCRPLCLLAMSLTEFLTVLWFLYCRLALWPWINMKSNRVYKIGRNIGTIIHVVAVWKRNPPFFRVGGGRWLNSSADAKAFSVFMFPDYTRLYPSIRVMCSSQRPLSAEYTTSNKIRAYMPPAGFRSRACRRTP